MRAVDEGMSRAEVARTFKVSLSTIKLYLKIRREGGSLCPKPIPGRPRRVSANQYEDLVAQLEAQPDATLEEHCEAWEKSHGVCLSIATMHRAIKHAGWSRKKRA